MFNGGNYKNKNLMKSSNSSNDKGSSVRYNSIQSQMTERAKNSLEIVQKQKFEKEMRESKRHDELVGVGREQVETLNALLQDSKNAVEQRDAIIHFIVQAMLVMESPKEEKKKSLTEVLTRIASLTTTGSDMVSIVNFIKKSLENLSEDK